ncbi:uncharacterized protein LOC144538425 [Centroberyx gerrardi]
MSTETDGSLEAAAVRDLCLTDSRLQQHEAWEEYLMPAPHSITILTELVLACSDRDFSVNENPPEGSYRFLRNPDSFHACLMQVCNSGWEAFNKSHSSMDQIRLYSAVTPQYLREVLESQGDDEPVQSRLASKLRRIGEISSECVKLSVEPMKKFSKVHGIIKELLKACVDSKRCYKEKEEIVKDAIMENEMREKLAAETKRRTEQVAKDLAEELRQDRHNYDKAMKSYPGRKERIYKCTVEVIAEFFPKKTSRTVKTSITEFRVTQCGVKLEKARELAEKNREDMRMAEESLVETSLALKKCRTREIALASTIDQLVKGLAVLGAVKEKWERMFLFFQMLSNIIKIDFSPQLMDFVVLDDDRKMFHRRLLRDVFLRASISCNQVNMISRTYTEVYSKYLMERVSRLSRLVDMKSRREDETLQTEQLLQAYQRDEEDILELVRKNKAEFERMKLQIEQQMEQNQ